MAEAGLARGPHSPLLGTSFLYPEVKADKSPLERMNRKYKNWEGLLDSNSPDSGVGREVAHEWD